MKETKLNRRVIKKMIKRLETLPESFIQRHFFILLNDETAEQYKRPKPICGTGECLAGEAVICNAPTVKQGIIALEKLARPRNGKLTHVAVEATKIMGLDLDVGPNNLSIFGSLPFECWPSPFGRQYYKAKTYKGQARAAISLLKAILKTDGKVLEQ